MDSMTSASKSAAAPCAWSSPSISEQTLAILNAPFPKDAELTAIPTLVELKFEPLQESSLLLGGGGGQRALARAVEDLDTLHKNPLELKLESSTICKLTSLVTNETHHSAQEALDRLSIIGSAIPRRVCQFPFKRNDIVWVCRTCQADETCVLCHMCYKQSNHDGHDVAFYHAQAGGCCDCGDPDAWDPKGFCPHHGGGKRSDANLPDEKVKDLVQTMAAWMVEKICGQTKAQHLRTKLKEQSVEVSADVVHAVASPTSPSAAGPIVPHEMSFNSRAASTSKSRGDDPPSKPNQEPALELGCLAREGHGLYLVLHADDVHTKQQIAQSLRHLLGTTYFNDALLTKLVSAVQTHGQLVVWGTSELLGDLTTPQLYLWLDGDEVATRAVGASMLERASRLQSLISSICTRDELLWEQRAVAVLEWLTALARSCDPLCQTVAESILPESHLIPMLESDFFLSSRITKVWHSLLLTLLAVPTFKSHLAAAYCDTYRHVTSDYARGMGVLERSSYTLSVQFLNRVTYVVDLVQHRDLLGKLGKALYETLAVALVGRRLNPNHYCLTHRRYSPCVSDLKCVLNVKGMARLFSSKSGTFLQDWLASLSLAQWMDAQTWRTFSQGHVETEPRGWVGAFNASISLGSLFERLLGWDDDDESPAPDSPLSAHVPTAVELTLFCLLEGLLPWQREEMANYIPTSNVALLDHYSKAPVALPYATTYTGDELAFEALPISHLAPWSFHLPLHRFVAACLREVCRRPVEQGMAKLLSELHDTEFFHSLLEFPVVVLSRAAQVRAGLWKRNGSLMFDQVLNYAEPPFCRALRDADILLVQFAALGCGTGSMITLLLHRFGIFDFMGFNPAPSVHKELYKAQVGAGMYSGEIRTVEDVENESVPLPWTFSPAKDVTSSLALLEEFLHLLIVLVSELPPIPPVDKAEHTVQAKQRLRREVIHRLASGPKTHSELSEVHHVLSNWDNVFLSEEGKLVNPDDATGAALGATLMEVADHKLARGRLEPNQWVLCDAAWEEYDPAFYHISLRSHQQAAESRPHGKTEGVYGMEPKSYAPPPPEPHPSFMRLRRDVTADATVLAVVYRTLHVHCRDSSNKSDWTGLRGSLAYQGDGLSETSLARAVHLLTLGAFAWESATPSDWRQHGGSYKGSVFYKNVSQPRTSDWIAKTLLANPAQIMDCNWYQGEEVALMLLKRLSMDGGSKSVGFIAQDQAVRAGAAWLCEFACKHNVDASKLLGANRTEETNGAEDTGETDMDRKKREAKARAMERMNAQAAQFAAMMNIDTEDSDDEKEPIETTRRDPLILASQEDEDETDRGGRRLSSTSFGGSEASFMSSTSIGSDKSPARQRVEAKDFNDKAAPPRLLKSRPVCIICNEDNTNASRDPETGPDDDGSGNRKRSRRRTDRNNALAFVGYAQPSTVLKGGGGTPPTNDDHSSLSSVRRFVGIHVALCGHAVHGECCESYLAMVLHRDDRIVGRREEFKCPLCQRLSNCLVPFIDVGVNWVDPPCGYFEDSNERTEEFMDLDDEASDNDVLTSSNLSLHSFLNTTPWWVGRDDKSVVWDGQSAFVAAPSAGREGDGDNDYGTADVSRIKPRRRSVRSLRKKDLYAAWSAMMKTPRFIRRRQTRSPSDSAMDGSIVPDMSSNALQMTAADDNSSGETLVWRRFMDLLSDMANRADAKRLGEQQFLQYCGEFRHYYTEKHAYNHINRQAGRESADWPACISTMPLTENRRQELSREKLLSKLLTSIQAFSYSCCAEAFEVKRLLKKEKDSGDGSVQTLLSKFGIAGLGCDDNLIVMPPPNPDLEDGSQPFDGRLGKLRYLGLAVMAAAGAVSADLVQLVLSLPLAPEGVVPMDPPVRVGDPVHRAPVVFPILFGHVLTHIVAALCAASGRARARSDSLELAWPVPFSTRGSFYGMSKEHMKNIDGVMKDCEGFIKLGLLARILQVLLGTMQIEPGPTASGRRVLVIKCIRQALLDHPIAIADPQSADQWLRSCAYLLDAALSNDVSMVVVASPAYETAVMNRFKIACQDAADAATLFLSEIGTIYQILVPGVALRQDKLRHQKRRPTLTESGDFRSLGSLFGLISDLGLEQIDDMLKSNLVRQVVSTWFRQACDHTSKSATTVDDASRGMLQKRLFETEGFRIYDWPMESSRTKDNDDDDEKKLGAVAGSVAAQPQDGSSPMELDSYPSSIRPARVEIRSSSSSGPLVTFSSRKSVHLLGGYAQDRTMPLIRPRIRMLPTSYTDLYAELGHLCPDSEQTALCLICGEVLNANGKGECTKHATKCGAGSCIFFLLQECQGLIMHGNKAVYLQSPYVDSHGETPQYRGRPLNLDVDRYDIFRELWTGHGIRQKVVQERGSARQVIIADFY